MARGAAPGGLSLLAGHDTTVMPLLCAMGGVGCGDAFPKYSSHVEFELARRSTRGGATFYVRVTYDRRPLRLLHDGEDLADVVNPSARAEQRRLLAGAPLGGGGWMPYDRFREAAMRHALPPSEYAAACASSAEPGAPPVSVDTLVQDTLTGSRSSGGGGDRAG